MMSSSLGVTQNTASNLPVKQRLAMEFRPKSKGLLNDFPYITYSIDDEELSSNLGEVLEKQDLFASHIPVKIWRS